jgi:hypothetical protein
VDYKDNHILTTLLDSPLFKSLGCKLWATHYLHALSFASFSNGLFNCDSLNWILLRLNHWVAKYAAHIIYMICHLVALVMEYLIVGCCEFFLINLLIGLLAQEC